jgi:hypothetical protein
MDPGALDRACQLGQPLRRQRQGVFEGEGSAGGDGIDECQGDSGQIALLPPQAGPERRVDKRLDGLGISRRHRAATPEFPRKMRLNP